MNRKERRASKQAGKRLMKKGWSEFEDKTQEAILKNGDYGGCPKNLHKMYLNNLYTVQVYSNQKVIGQKAIKVMVRRNDGKAICNWPHLQRIKNEIFGEEVEAIQLLPKQSELVDEANLYWFWILYPRGGKMAHLISLDEDIKS